MSDTVTPTAPPRVKDVASGLFFGGLWNWALFGVLVVQFYVYCYNFPRDKWQIKFLVFTVFFLETLQTILNGADMYYWFVAGYGDLKHLVSPYVSTFDVPIIESVVSLMVEFFFVHRIWVLSIDRRSAWLYLLLPLICLCSVFNAAAAITGGVIAHIRGTFATGQLRVTAIVWLVGNTAADILIASAMFYFLVTRRKDNNGYFGDHALMKVVRLTIETNLVTTSVGFVSFLLVVIYPHKNYYTCPTSILGKLYSNTLLVSLNNRISIRDAAISQGIANRMPAPAMVSTLNSDHCTDITVTVTTEVGQPPATYKSSFGEEV